MEGSNIPFLLPDRLGRFRGDVIVGDIQHSLFVLAHSHLQYNRHAVRARLERTGYWGTVSMRITIDLPSPTFSLLPSPPALSAKNQQRGANAKPKTCHAACQRHRHTHPKEKTNVSITYQIQMARGKPGLLCLPPLTPLITPVCAGRVLGVLTFLLINAQI